MNKRNLFFFLSCSIVLLIIVIQSVVVPKFFNNEIMPDISLIAIIYFAVNYGKNVGQTFGFIQGIVLDSLSGVPFGLNALLRVIMGFLLGFFNGKIFLDKFVLPAFFVAICSFIKILLLALIVIIFPIKLNITIFSVKNIIEIGLNILLTPFVFAFFRFIDNKINISRDNT